jgi:hypothetical protein
MFETFCSMRSTWSGMPPLSGGPVTCPSQPKTLSASWNPQVIGMKKGLSMFWRTNTAVRSFSPDPCWVFEGSQPGGATAGWRENSKSAADPPP